MKILLRLTSELTTKSDKVRAKFVGRMIRNMNAAFAAAQIKVTIDRQWSRLFVITDDERALEVLSRTFGLSSFSLVDREASADLSDIVHAGVEAFSEVVRGKTFAVRVRRTGSHSYSSVDLARRLGAALRPLATGVDLENPQVNVSVEVRRDQAFLYSRRERGAGGLPLGTSGRVLVLMSGGFDSAVATWLMQKRGLEVDYLFCNLAGASYERSVMGIAKFMQATWSQGSKTYFHAVDFQAIVAHIKAVVRPSFAQVVLKRLFYRAAEQVAAHIGATAVVTGECIAQVSSQTLQNLVAIEAGVNLPIFRPVIGFDKEEITDMARRMGVFDLCAAVQEYCQLVPEKPVVACKPERLADEEARIDQSLVRQAVASRRIVYLPTLTASELASTYVYADAIPPDAVVIDCREAEHFAAWHYPGAQNRELHDLMLTYRKLDKTRTYILYCPVGLQSAVAAEAMQKSGWQAYSLRGGMASLRDVSPPLA